MRGARWGIALIAAGLPVAGCGGASGPARHERLVVTPRVSLLDQPLRVVARGLRPHSTATLRASWRSYDGLVWAGAERIRAGRNGAVVVARGDRGAPGAAERQVRSR
jgi:hypothetical protein